MAAQLVAIDHLARGVQSAAGMYQPASSQELHRVLGDIDPLTIERILDTDATIDEVAEALATLDHQDTTYQPSSTRVTEVREILLTAFEDDDSQDEEAFGRIG